MLNRAEETAETFKGREVLSLKKIQKKIGDLRTFILNIILQTNYLKSSIKIQEMTMAISDVCFYAK